MKKRILNEIVYSVEFIGFAAILAIVCVSKGIYLPLSFLTFLLINFFWSDKLRFCKCKLGQFILRKYPYTMKMMLVVALITTIGLSWWFIWAFICSIFFSILWKEYMNVFNTFKIYSNR